MKIAVACDHGGLGLKKSLLAYLEKCGHTYIDFGTYTTDSCDYPDFALAAAEYIVSLVIPKRRAIKEGIKELLLI